MALMSSRNFSYPMNSEMGSKTCTAVERFIRCSQGIYFSWKTAENNGIKSSVTCHPVFNEISQVSLCAGAQELIVLHATDLNFQKSVKGSFLPAEEMWWRTYRLSLRPRD